MKQRLLPLLAVLLATILTACVGTAEESQPRSEASTETQALSPADEPIEAVALSVDAGVKGRSGEKQNDPQTRPSWFCGPQETRPTPQETRPGNPATEPTTSPTTEPTTTPTEPGGQFPPELLQDKQTFLAEFSNYSLELFINPPPDTWEDRHLIFKVHPDGTMQIEGDIITIVDRVNNMIYILDSTTMTGQSFDANTEEDRFSDPAFYLLPWIYGLVENLEPAGESLVDGRATWVFTTSYEGTTNAYYVDKEWGINLASDWQDFGQEPGRWEVQNMQRDVVTSADVAVPAGYTVQHMGNYDDYN